MATRSYIALEGIEGVGKSTQASLLAINIGGTLTRENGGTPLGREIRNLTHGFQGPMSPLAEAHLFAADRAQNVYEVVKTALKMGPVVTDRSVYSSVAYQGAGRDLGMRFVWEMNESIGILPDVVVYLHAPLEVALERIRENAWDRFETEGTGFFKRVYNAFEAMYSRSQHPDGFGDAPWIKVDGTQPITKVHAEIMQRLREIGMVS